MPATKPGRRQEHVAAETDADGPPVQVADDDRLAARAVTMSRAAGVVVRVVQVHIDRPGRVACRVEELRPAADLGTASPCSGSGQEPASPSGKLAPSRT